jgi:hypothetical protein
MLDAIAVSFAFGFVVGGSLIKIACMKAISDSNKEKESEET